MRFFLLLLAAVLLMGAAATKTEESGVLTVIAIDRTDGTAEHEYWLHTGKETIRLKLPRDHKHGRWQTGDKIKAHGRKSRDRGQQVMELDGEADMEPQALIAPLPDWAVRAPNQLLGLCVAYSDSSPPCTSDQLRAFIQTTTNPFYQEFSHGALSFVGIQNPNSVGDFVDVQITQASGGCDTFAITQQALEAAAAKGIPTTGAMVNGEWQTYKRFLYVIPPSPCGWAGLATVGWTGGFAIANAEISHRVISHEIGHNLGLFHCQKDGYAYGDFTCVMGNMAGGLGAFELSRLGWMDNGAGFPNAQIIAGPGVYTINVLEDQRNGVKALKIAKPGTAAVNYYISYRSAKWTGNDQYTPGVYLHTGDDGCPGCNNLENWQPNTTVLSQGMVGTVPGLPWEFRTISQDSLQAVIQVGDGAPGTAPNAPINLTLQ